MTDPAGRDPIPAADAAAAADDRLNRRARLLESVRRYLAELDHDEPLPDGIDPTLIAADVPPADLATLSAAVTQAAREVQVQGRTMKRLADALERNRNDAAGRVGVELDELLDLYDSLSRCENASRATAARLPRPARWFGSGALFDGVLTGVGMLRDRVAALLSRVQVTPIDSDGQRFDAATMRAVGVTPPSPAHPAGQVVETVRRGFCRGDQILRPAEVRVAGEAAAKESPV